jgi:amino acid transporter
MRDPDMHSADDRQDPPRRLGFGATMVAVMWSFIGIRRRSEYHREASALNPLAVVVAGVLGGAVFVLAIVLFVRWVVGA